MMKNSSRREFLKQSGLVTASLVLGIPTSRASTNNSGHIKKKTRNSRSGLFRETQKVYKRGVVTAFFNKNPKDIFNDAKPEDKYALVLVNEEVSDFSNGEASFDTLGYCQKKETAIQIVKDYDQKDQIAAYIEL